ncbi:MAG TPA: choice-of-anchor Q domain-containing protein [Chthoniobacterales bacterium]|jgi:hypothetical protein|nr:choice-of-anchor Q domain-containing protein [Chthoniobacterales bacterium]
MNIKKTAPLLFLVCLGWATSSFASIFYVRPTGSDANSGTSWPSAKKTIQAAINAASAGDTVIVNDGTYTLTSPITISSAIVLSSVNGASATVLDGQQSVRCVSITDPGAIVNGFTVQNGRARTGGGIYCINGTIENCTVLNNIATGNDSGDGLGGGIYVSNGNVRFCNVHNNTANSVVANQYSNSASGGGIYSVNGAIANSTISDNLCTANYANGGGGDLNGGTLTKCQVTGNSATALFYPSGGGINASPGATIDGCVISGNSTTATETGAYTTCDANGGGFYIGNGSTVQNTLVFGNSSNAPYGFAGGGGGWSSGSTVRNCSITGNSVNAPSNTSQAQGGGMLWGYSDTCVNNIITFNSAPVNADNSDVNASSYPQYVNCWISADPLFVNASASDFHLSPNSPCINAGVNQAWMTGAQDLDGNARIINTSVDIGAYEFTTTPPTPTELGNISTRMNVGTSDDVLIGGIIIKGNAPKKVIIRAIGPELTQYGVPGALRDPTLELHNGSGAIIGRNDNWGTTIRGGVITSDQVAEMRASGLAPSDSHESAIISTLQPGSYTAIVRGVNNTTGIALIEVYDLDATADANLANISTRGLVGTGDSAMIGGLIILGSTPEKVIVRALGPELTAHGVTGALQNPTLELHDSHGNLIAFNDNWKESQRTEISATGLAPTDDRESAIVATLPPGNYTAIVHGVNGTTGVALVEVYKLN